MSVHWSSWWRPDCCHWTLRPVMISCTSFGLFSHRLMRYLPLTRGHTNLLPNLRKVSRLLMIPKFMNLHYRLRYYCFAGFSWACFRLSSFFRLASCYLSFPTQSFSQCTFRIRLYSSCKAASCFWVFTAEVAFDVTSTFLYWTRHGRFLNKKLNVHFIIILA